MHLVEGKYGEGTGLFKLVNWFVCIYYIYIDVLLQKCNKCNVRKQENNTYYTYTFILKPFVCSKNLNKANHLYITDG